MTRLEESECFLCLGPQEVTAQKVEPLESARPKSEFLRDTFPVPRKLVHASHTGAWGSSTRLWFLCHSVAGCDFLPDVCAALHAAGAALKAALKIGWMYVFVHTTLAYFGSRLPVSAQV